MQDWQYVIIHFAMFYGIVIGYTSIRINYKKRQINQLRFFKIIIYLSYFAFVFCIPNAVKINLSHIQLNVKNPLIAYAIGLTICMRLTFLLLVLVLKEKRDGQLSKWFEKLWSIQASYFDRFQSIPADISLRKFLIVDAFLMLSHCFSLAINVWEMNLLGKVQQYYDIYILCCIINFQHFILWHHEMLLCVLHECFSKINYQLEHLVRDPKLSLIYYQLTKLLQDLNAIFGPLVLCLQICLIITNSIVGYVMILYFWSLEGNSPEFALNEFSFILGGRLYILLGVRQYLYFRFCDRVSKETRKTADILKNLATKDVDYEIEIIFLNIVITNNIVSIEGMFSINLNSFFTIIAQTAISTIVLVQVDLQNQQHRQSSVGTETQ